MVEVLDPLQASDWEPFVRHHPSAGVFHTSAWARLLVEAYRFRPVYLVQREAGRILAAWPLMEMGGGLRSRRASSLPFTDACPPLLTRSCQPTEGEGEVGSTLEAMSRQRPRDLDEVAAGEPLLKAALDLGRRRAWRTLELRDAAAWTPAGASSVRFYGHAIDLTGGDQEALNRCESSFKRSLRKAVSSGLRVEERNDRAAVRAYFRLHGLTRRRHGLPPQPYAFFETLHRHLLETGSGTVILVLKNDRPVAGAVFLYAAGQALYKFGASDENYQALRPNNLVFREAMRICVERGFRYLDLGRTSLHNEGLRRFKLGLGSQERVLSYLRYDLSTRRVVPTPDRASGWHTRLFRMLPCGTARFLGRILYRFAA